MLFEKLDKIKQIGPVKRVLEFIESPYFLIAYSVLLYLLSIFNIGLTIMYAAVLLFLFICLFSTDIMPAMALFLLTFFGLAIMNKPFENEFSYFTQPHVIAQIAVLLVLIVVAIVFALLRRKRENPAKKPSKILSISVIIFAVTLLLNGVFHSPYGLDNISMGLLTAATLSAFYFFFSYCNRYDGDSVKKLARILLCAGLILSAQIITLTIINFVKTLEISRFASTPVSSNPNIAAGVLVLTMSMSFYLAATEKRGWLYCLAGIGFYAISLILMSRNAILIGTIGLVIGLSILCFKGKNKKSCLIVSASALVIALIAGGVMLAFNIIEVREISDSGRFDIWRQGIELFKKAPIFGGGFSTYIEYGIRNDDMFSNLYHNIIIQMLAACGIVGLAAFLFHIVEVFRLTFSKTNLKRLFMGLFVILLMGLSMFDNHFFCTYLLIFYCAVISVIEHDYHFDKSSSNIHEEIADRNNLQ